jgi:PAS domain S-box-containing protein
LRVTFVSDSFRSVLGYEPNGALADKSFWSERMHPDDLRHARGVWAAPAERGARSFECRFRHADGAWRWLHVEVRESPADEGDAVEHHGVLIDVSAQRQAEEALRRTEDNFRLLTEQSRIAVSVHRDGKVVYANPALARMLGYDRVDEIIGQETTAFVHPEEHDRVHARKDIIANTRYGGAEERRLVRRDGSSVTVENEAVAIDYDGRPSIVIVSRDLTERREMFARLALADRISTAGTLAAGVAHEINNPLAFLLANLTYLDRELPRRLDGDPRAGARHDAETIFAPLRDALEAASRVNAVVADFRSISRGYDEARGPVDVHAVLRSSIKMVGGEIRDRATLVEALEPVPRVLASESRLGQVFLNLLINAAQSIPEGSADTNTIRVRTFVPSDGWVAVEVKDTGCGIPSDDIARIFDPFFTTKPVGVGTGLGLSICQGVVQSLGGEISVESLVGIGSTFRVTLPAAPSAHGVVERRIEPSPSGDRRVRRVLVVDDEPLMGQSLRFLLEPEFEVASVTRAPLALSTLTGGEQFDAILCDLMMPDMNGMDFHAAVSTAVPELARRIVFLTGGAFTPSAQRFLGRVKNPVLQKPFDEGTLRAALRAVFDG